MIGFETLSLLSHIQKMLYGLLYILQDFSLLTLNTRFVFLKAFFWYTTNACSAPCFDLAYCIHERSFRG